MKKLLLAAVASVVLAAGPAVAADLGRRAPAYIPPPAPPPPTFTGCYVNGGAGYGLWNIDHFSSPGIAGEHADTDLHLGRSRLVRHGRRRLRLSVRPRQRLLEQLGRRRVRRLRLHGPAVRILNSPAASALATRKKRTLGPSADGSAIWSLRMSSRTGMAATLKPALMRSTFPTPSSLAPVGSISSHTYHGWFIGGGTEIALSGLFGMPLPSGLFWRSEYRFSSFDSADLPVTAVRSGVTNVFENMKPYVQTITTSLVWKFNWWGH